MNPIVFALRHPITVLVGVVALVAAGWMAVFGPDAATRMKVDIFPRLKLPVIYVAPPFGGNARTVVVRADPDRLKAYQLSPDDLVKALSAGNVISPSGAIRVQEQMPLVPVNSMVAKPKELGKIPVPVGPNKYIMLEDVVTRDPLTKEPLIEDA